MDNAPQAPAAEPNGTNVRVTKVVSGVALATSVWVVVIGIIGAFVASPAGTGAGTGSYGDIITGLFWGACLSLLGIRLRGSRTRGAMMLVAVLGLLLAAGSFLTLGGYLYWGHDWVHASKARKVCDLLLLLPGGIAAAMVGVAALPSFGGRKGRSEA